MLSRSMETNISSEAPHPFYGPGASDYNGIGKKSLEWDLNEWKWDGDLFVATPLNAGPSDCRNKKRFPVPVFQGISNTSSSSSGETDSGSNAKGKGDSEKRRRVVVVEDDEPYDKDGSLTLKLGGHVYPITDSDLTNWDGKNDKKGKVQGGNSNRAMCQVEGCGANLSDAKDYHRRHKVCEMHAKASQALVGNATQRFCQQCSRFHLLQEFDEGKRSCRRRLAGHNKRRRKTLPDTVANGSSLADDRASGYLLISLLRILSNLHSDRSGQSNDQDLLPHLLKNLASLAGSFDERNLSGLLQASQDMQKTANFAGPSSDSALALRPNGISAQESSRPLCSTTKMNCNSDNHDSSVRPFDQSMSGTVTAVEVPSKGNNTETSHIENFQDVPHRRSTNPLAVQDGFMAKPDVLCSLNQVLPVGSVLERAESTLEKVRLKNFDLNSTYDDGPDTVEGLEKLATPANMGTASLSYPSWLLQDSRQASPPQTSGNSDSASAQSLSSSNGDAQSRTDRIVFKLFGKDPSDFPLILRSQILNWLSNSPTEIESYIRPGCIILTIYLRLAVPTWEELCSNLSSSMKRLLDVTGNDFWRIGWVYVRLHHRMAFIYNGKVVLDAPLPTESRNDCKIVSITPIAVTISGTVDFKVKGFNLARSSMRLLCAFEGKYLVEETTQALIDGTDAAGENDGSECLSFSCFTPNFTGRGFIEVEDHGLSSGFFPFIVAEHDVCTEIRMLENTINVNWIDGNLQERMAGTKARTQALDFLHEIGWLLRRNHLRSRSENMNSCSDIFSLTRFKWLMEFSMNHDWCAVVKKLLDILYGGSIDAGGHSVELLLSDMSLLHSAVRRNCRPMVEFLLRYVPAKALEKVGSPKAQDGSGPIKYFFRPDTAGPSNVTPLHIAATRGDAESMLDALTDDPGRVGITAWKYARDDTGFTPEDYARVRGFESYLELVNKKDDLKSGAGHVVLNMPGDVVTKKQKDGKSIGFGLQIEQSSKMKPKQQPYCKRCSQQLAYRTNRSSLLYRPVMLAMVGIAAVCVCVGLLLKGPPEVLCVFQPFNWELLDYGPI